MSASSSGEEATKKNAGSRKGTTSTTFWDVFAQHPQQSIDLVEKVSTRLIDIADRYVKFREEERDHQRKMELIVSTHSRKTLFVGLLGIIAFGIIIGTLVLYRVVSGDAFLFYVGVVMGFLLSLIRREIVGEPIIEDEEN